MSRDLAAVVEESAADAGALAFYRKMATIRAVENTLLELHSSGKLNGTVHSCIGQEACAVGVVSALDRERDVIFSNHRGHGHYLAYCDDVDGLVAEVMGRATGVCSGIGGSQHLHRDNFYSNGIQGGIVPVAVGTALAEREKGTGAITVVFLGDGTFGEGVVYEALNIASLWGLPVLFVVEHNGYAQSTPSHLQHAGDLTARALPFGIPVEVADGNDVHAVHGAAAIGAENVRASSQPRLLFLNTYRLGPHSKGDDTRDPEEIQRMRARDPLTLLKETIPAELCDAVDAEVAERITAVVARAEAAPVAELHVLDGRQR